MNRKDEKLLREFVRRELIKPSLKILREEQRKEDSVRLWVRSQIREFQMQDYCTVIHEAKDMANPHPNTGINKLRDAIRKAKPSIKAKFQQLTTASEQRESFTNHFLAAFVRLFDQLDALSASGEAEDVASDPDLAAEPSVASSSDELEAPTDADLDDIDKQLDDLMEALGLTEQEEVEGEDNDVVSDELEAEKEASKNLSQVEKDVEKKKSQDREREDFGGGLEGDSTGRNQAYDTFNLVQSYFSDAYLDLNNQEDSTMFTKWCLYNLKLLLQSYEEELNLNAEAPDIQDPQ